MPGVLVVRVVRAVMREPVGCAAVAVRAVPAVLVGVVAMRRLRPLPPGLPAALAVPVVTPVWVVRSVVVRALVVRPETPASAGQAEPVAPADQVPMVRRVSCRQVRRGLPVVPGVLVDKGATPELAVFGVMAVRVVPVVLVGVVAMRR